MEHDLRLHGSKEDIDLVVVTDGEGILGIGDQGVGGILICIGKSAIYTLGSGIDPNRVLPVVRSLFAQGFMFIIERVLLGSGRWYRQSRAIRS